MAAETLPWQTAINTDVSLSFAPVSLHGFYEAIVIVISQFANSLQVAA